MVIICKIILQINQRKGLLVLVAPQTHMHTSAINYETFKIIVKSIKNKFEFMQYNIIPKYNQLYCYSKKLPKLS